MSENANTTTQEAPAPGPYDVFLAYASADEDIARALQAALHRLRPGLRIWCEKSRIGVADAFNQSADEAIAGCSVVLAIWTAHSARTGAFSHESRRALTLRKPIINLLVGAPNAALSPPYSKFSSHPLETLLAAAGRSEGWLPPRRPAQAEIDAELAPVVTRLRDYLQMVGPPASDISDGLVSGIIDAAGEPHSASFETLIKSIAPGDPATALEVLLISGYNEAAINTLVSPQSARIADLDGPRPAWGAWYIRPHVRRVTPLHKDNGALYAVGGFLAAALLALTLWLVGSTVSEGQGDGPQVAGGAGPATSGAVTPASAARLPVCTLGSDGSITGAECRLTANIAAQRAAGASPASAAEPTLEGCIIRLDGSISNTPCRLAAPYTPATQARASDCVVNPDGSITGVPCTLQGAFTAPEPVEIEVPANAPPPKLCIRAANGAITDVPCMVASAIAAPQPERIEVPGERVVEIEALPVCDLPRPGEEVEPGCKLEQPLQLAFADCNGALSNLPCTLSQAPQRLTSDEAQRAVPRPTTPTPTALPVRPTTAVTPAAPSPSPGPMTPIDMPATLLPCEEAIVAPCRYTVAKGGLFTLSEIAESFYGDRRAWCMVYRANVATFGDRNQTRVAGDPNCIFASDVLDLPRGQSRAGYTLNGCPPARTQNRCTAPIER